MNKDYIKYHQRTYAELIFENGFQNMREWPYEIRLLAMLFKSQGQKSREIRENLTVFCTTKYPDIPVRFWLVAIGKAVSFVEKKYNVLVECPYVDMYTDEIDYIDEQDISDGAKRVLFAIMVQKKLDKFCYEARRGETYSIFTYANNKRLQKLARIARLPRGYTGVDGLRELYEHGLIDVMHCKGSPFRLNFVEHIAFDGHLAVRITDYEQLGTYWDWLHSCQTAYVCVKCWKPFRSQAKNCCYCSEHQGYQNIDLGKRRVVCCDCGAEFEVNAKNHKTIRCQDCQALRRRENTRTSVQKYRQKSM